MPVPDLTQRWWLRSPRWVPTSAGGFDPDRYDVVALGEPRAAKFLALHHYQPTLPATTHRYGLLEQSDTGEPRLVGVATLGVPASRGVLANVFPELEPYRESLDFNRLVLLDEIPANAESWFCARAFQSAAADGVRGVVTFADPVPRWRTTGERPELIKPGHVGCLYQALGFDYLGRATPRSLVLLPDATALNARAIAKVTGGETGRRGVIARIVGFGAPAPDPDADLKQWLAQALRTIGARRVRHPGNHKYALRLGTRAQRRRTVIALAPSRFPKPLPELVVA
jgi:hypothetical protein